MKETLLLTKHMREFPENSHKLEVFEKNNGYSALKKSSKIMILKVLLMKLRIQTSEAVEVLVSQQELSGDF